MISEESETWEQVSKQNLRSADTRQKIEKKLYIEINEDEEHTFQMSAPTQSL